MSYGLSDIPNVGEAVTLTVWGEVAADRTVGVYNTFGNREAAHPPSDTGGKRNPDNPDRLSFQKLFRKKTVTIRLLAPPCPNAAPAAFFASFEVGKGV